MTDVVVLLAFALLLLGVVGSVVPALPGAPLSLVGVYLYWWNSGYAEPGSLVLIALTIVGLFAIAVSMLAGVVSARASGVPTRVAVIAGAAGFVLFFVGGPIGLLVGVAGTVFLATLYGGGGMRRSGRAALLTTLGMLGSGIVELLLTLSMLVVMLLVAL